MEKIQRMFVWSLTNAPLNAFYSNENNDITSNKFSKKENFEHSAKFCISVTYFSISIICFLNLIIVCN